MENKNCYIADERYQLADEAICEAFCLLIKEKDDIKKITVSEITKKAGIVRATFYNHYESVPHLVQSMEKKTIRDMFDFMEHTHPHSDREMCLSYFEHICEYAKKNPFFANLIEGNRCDDLFEKTISKLHEYVKKREKETNGDVGENYSYMVAGTIGMTIGILHKWIRDDMQVSSGYIADMLTEVFLNGIMPCMK